MSFRFFSLCCLVRLSFICDGEFSPALGSASRKNLPSTFCGHSSPKSIFPVSLHFAWLIGPLHFNFSLCARIKAVIINIFQHFSRWSSILAALPLCQLAAGSDASIKSYVPGGGR